MTKNRRHKAAIRQMQRTTGASYLEAQRQMPTLADVMESQPRLTDSGFGVFDEHRKSAEEARQKPQSDRETLRRHEARVLQVRDWLLENIAPIKTPTQVSYSLKHVVERATGEYVSNGELIAAAVMAGYPMGRPSGLNVMLGMSQRDLDRVRATG
jgi:hypothetical protein